MKWAAMAMLFVLPATAWADDKMDDAVRKVTAAVASANLPKSTYDPNEFRPWLRDLAGPNDRLDGRPYDPERPKMDDAIRNGLSLSVSTCFNIYTQNPMGTEQDRRLERCLGRVLAGYQIARDMMANKEAAR